jgi:hypothetical protein
MVNKEVLFYTDYYLILRNLDTNEVCFYVTSQETVIDSEGNLQSLGTKNDFKWLLISKVHYSMFSHLCKIVSLFFTLAFDDKLIKYFKGKFNYVNIEELKFVDDHSFYFE